METLEIDSEVANQETNENSDRWFLLVNPIAGGGQGLLVYPQISRLLHDEGIICEPHFTEHKFHAVELTVRAVNEGYRKIIVLGGDGTLHEVVNGLFIQTKVDPKGVLLGVVGVGTGNDWLRTFGFEEGRYTETIKAIKNEWSVLQDVGVVDYEEAHYRQTRYMVGVAGTGFDAYVIKRFEHRNMKRRRRASSYLWCVIRSFFRYKNTGAKIYIDDKLVYNDLLFSAAVGVCKFNGGGIQQLPDAVIDDGLFDMTIIRPIHFWHILFRLFYLYDGNIYRIGHTSKHRGERIRIESTPEMRLEVDGELLGGTPIDFSIKSKAIKVVVSSRYLEERERAEQR
ncbi:MAG: diacylglycerol kinase family lipid kinase [Rikenellaceae bacterium]